MCPRSELANERVQTNAAGQAVLKFKTAWLNGTAHLVMSPLQFMQRLAALVPRLRLTNLRLHPKTDLSASCAVYCPALPRSGCHGDGKRMFENFIPLLLPPKVIVPKRSSETNKPVRLRSL